MFSARQPVPRRAFRAGDLRRCSADGRRLYLTLEDTAAAFNVSLSTVLSWVRQGLLPEYRLGGRIYLNREEVIAYWSLFKER